MKIRLIHTDTDYEAALRRIEVSWGSPEGTPQAGELEVLVNLVEAYEREHYPIGQHSSIDAIRAREERDRRGYAKRPGKAGESHAWEAAAQWPEE